MKQINKYNITRIDAKEATLDQLKLFTTVPFFIPWYRSSESHKVFPLFIDEVSVINASKNYALGLVSVNPQSSHTDMTLWIADDGTKPVSRVVSFKDSRYNQENQKNAGGIGFFECIEDKMLAEQMLTTAIDDLISKKCDEIDRTSDFDTNRMNGIQIGGFQYEPYYMEPYGTPYYPSFFEDSGFTKRNDWYSIQVNDTSGEEFKGRMEKMRLMVEKISTSNSERGELFRQCRIRDAYFDRHRFPKEVKTLESLYNLMWGELNHSLGKGKHHPQQVTMTYPMIKKLANDIKLVDRPEYVKVLEKSDGGWQSPTEAEPIGISASVPNVNEKISAWDRQHPGYAPSPKFYNPADIARDVGIFNEVLKNGKRNFESLRVLILGVKEEYRKSGLDGALYLSGFEAAIKNGIKRASFSQLADINLDIVNPLTKMGDIAMTWRVYGLKL